MTQMTRNFASARVRRDTPQSDILDRQPPCDLEAESGVLCCVLLVPELLEKVRMLLQPGDFYADANQRVYKAMLGLHQDGKLIDVVLLRRCLKRSGDFDEVVGDWYLAELERAVPTATNAEQYARIVREKALLREIIAAATAVLCRAYAPNAEPLTIAGDGERRFAEIRQQCGAMA